MIREIYLLTFTPPLILDFQERVKALYVYINLKILKI
nr:MAG TPA: hypothetical protein [Bacteriophage sp.]